MKTNLILFTIILLFVIGQSCKRAPCNGKGPTIVMDTTKIAVEDLLKIPFTGSDTLTYYSDQGDTAILIGKSKRLYYGEGGGSLHEDCGKTVNLYYEIQEFEFVGNNPELSYLQYHYQMGDSYSGRNEKMEYWINSAMDYIQYQFVNDLRQYTDSCIIEGSTIYGLPENRTQFKAIYNYKYGFIKISFPQGKTWLKKIK